MTKVKITAGICGNITNVTAEDTGDEIHITVESGCPAVNKLTDAVGSDFDAYSLCFNRPGTGELYEYAAENFPGHCACPVVAGIVKCIEAEAGLALKKNAAIEFID